LIAVRRFENAAGQSARAKLTSSADAPAFSFSNVLRVFGDTSLPRANVCRAFVRTSICVRVKCAIGGPVITNRPNRLPKVHYQTRHGLQSTIIDELRPDCRASTLRTVIQPAEDCARL
jgi:hypothetical protein